ncbi:ABC transporter substrate-binding protein [Aquicoccus sp. SU-CL01552]|uniref:ABC transporter substrate-binding protein n=1 Tax=Aquicoccus sp. SU-CL01552 TaxID=3127656 RepID=UPI0031055E30
MKLLKTLRAGLVAGALATAAVVSPASAQAVDNQTLVVGTMWEALPYKMTARRGRLFNEVEILDTLVKLDYDMSLKPGLATDWTQESPTEWVFTLREGVVFHDGEKLTAEVVKNSLAHVMELLPYASGLLAIDRMEAIDEIHLRIVTKVPFYGLPNQLTDAFTGIYAPSSFGPDGAFVKPVGTGPYMLKDYVEKSHTDVERFDEYWGEKPAIRTIRLRYIPDHNVRVIALEAGEIDLVDNPPPAEAKRLEAEGKQAVYRAPAAGLYYMVMNTRDNSPLSDVRVRRAVDRLIDRSLITDFALDGAGYPGETFFSPELGGFPEEKPREVDPEAAAALLEQAGYSKTDGQWRKDGKPLVLDLVSYASRTEMPAITEAVVALLAEAGIQATLNMETWGALVDRTKQSKFDGAIVFWTPEMTGHPDLHLMPHLHSSSNLDYNGYGNPALDALLEKGRSLPEGDARDATYSQALEIIVEDVPIVPLVHKMYLAAANKRLQGYRIHPSGFFYDFKNVHWTD